MPLPRVTVVIPTLSAGFALWECLESLRLQTFRDLFIVIVDNSGTHQVEANWPPACPRDGVSLLHPGANLGYGGAVNLAARQHPAEFVAVMNDDAAAEPDAFAHLVAALDAFPSAGSAAPQVRLHGLPDSLDSAGMRIAADGTSKQRGHLAPAARFATPEEILLPSGSAALYRSEMLAATGGFDDSFFLYCEDTDLGLRALWAGWTSRYVPAAVFHHRYSLSAGRASLLKAFYVERNRLLLILKNFPLSRLLKAFLATPLRYLFHLSAMRRGQGAAAAAQQAGAGPFTLAACVLRAHASALASLPRALRQRRQIRRSARLSVRDFLAALDRHSISLREVAEL